MNRLFRLNKIEKINTTDLKSPKKDVNNISGLIKNAYLHPCESSRFVDEYLYCYEIIEQR